MIGLTGREAETHYTTNRKLVSNVFAQLREEVLQQVTRVAAGLKKGSRTSAVHRISTSQIRTGSDFYAGKRRDQRKEALERTVIAQVKRTKAEVGVGFARIM